MYFGALSSTHRHDHIAQKSELFDTRLVRLELPVVTKTREELGQRDLHQSPPRGDAGALKGLGFGMHGCYIDIHAMNMMK